MHQRRHPICAGCYVEKVSAQLPIAELAPTVRCCRCNRPTSARLWWHVEAKRYLVPYCPDVESN